MNLTTIPRASTITCTTANIGEVATIVINRKSSSFKHTVQYLFGNSGTWTTIATKTTNTTISWTIPTAFYAIIPNSKSGRGTLRCYTFDSNDNTVGNVTTCDFFVTVNESINEPKLILSFSLENNTLPRGGTVYELTRSETTIISGYSNINVHITATAKNSATIASIKATSENGREIHTTGNNLNDTLTKVSSGIVNYIATDSRNINSSGTQDHMFDVINYSPFKISQIVLERENETSSNIKFQISGTYSPIRFDESMVPPVINAVDIRYRYREAGGTWSSYNDINVTNTNGVFSYSNNTLRTDCDYRKTYEFEFLVGDMVEICAITRNITKGISVLDIYEDDVNFNYEVHKQNGKLIGETELYSSSPTTGDIELNDEVGNYKRIKIYGYVDTDETGYVYFCKEVWFPLLGCYADITAVAKNGSTYTYLISEVVSLLSNEIERGEQYLNKIGSSVTRTQGDYVYITRVIGIK